MKLKIIQSWRRNTPSTISGESITYQIVYQSFDKAGMDEFEKTFPSGVIIKEAEWTGGNTDDNPCIR